MVQTSAVTPIIVEEVVSWGVCVRPCVNSACRGDVLINMQDGGGRNVGAEQGSGQRCSAAVSSAQSVGKSGQRSVPSRVARRRSH